MKKKFCICLVIMMLCFPHVKALEPVKCKVSEAYLEWSKLSSEEKKKYITPEYCHSDGLKGIKKNKIIKNKKLLGVNYPSYYRAASTPVRNQRATPTCWAFASSTVLESHILKKYNLNYHLSVQHLNYMESQSFYDISSNPYSRIRYVNDGGRFTDAAVYYINRYGPVNEKDVPTNTSVEVLPNINSKEIFGRENVLDVNDIEFIGRSNSGACTNIEKNKIKSLIMNYGPTGAAMYIDYKYLSNGAYIYKTNNKYTTSNHDITIVGWDDNYSVNNFNNGYFKPKNNGAWIIQNSHGTDFGNNGFAYISYEDDEICTQIFSIRDADGSIIDNKYITTQQYSYYNFDGPTMTIFNKKKNIDEYLYKISFKVDEPTSYKVYYYQGDAAKDKVKLDKMKLIGSGSVNYSGWTTIQPDTSVVIPSNVSKYSIAVSLGSNSTPLTINSEYVDDEYYTSKEEFKKNTAYVYDNGYWFDLYDSYGNYKYKNTINSFTNDIILDITSAKVDYTYDDYFDVYVKINAKWNGVVTGIDLSKDGNIISESKNLNKSITKGNNYTLVIRKYNLANFKNGKYQVRVYTKNGLYYTQDVNINVIPINKVSITNTKGLKLAVGKTLKLNTSLSPSNYNSTSPVLSWTSSNNGVATVDQNGVVTGVSAGNVKISAKTKNNLVTTYELIIEKPITEIVSNRSKIQLEVGDTHHVYSYVLPKDTTDDKTITWKSSDKTKLAVEVVNNEEIIVKALSSGIVTLTGTTSNGATKTIEVLIKGVTLNKNNLKLELKNSYNLKATVIDDKYNITHNAIWSSSNSKIAKVDKNGKVTALKVGTATITARDNNGNISKSSVKVTKIQASSFSTSKVGTKTYNGRYQKPSVTVKYKGKTLKKNKDYTVKYYNNKKPGKATIKITAKKSNLYEGTKKIYFIIKPKKVTIKTPKTRSKSITVYYYKQSGVSGYQVAYKVKGSKTWKYVTTTGSSKKITGLTKGKTYQVKVQSYKKIDGKKYYGSWSSTKTIKCK